MKRVEPIPFCIEHLDLFSWREEDLRTYGTGSEISEALKNHDGGECFTGVYNGQIVVIGGIVPRTNKTAYAFTIFSEHADNHKIITAKAVRQMFKSIVESIGIHRIVTYNRLGAENHNKWCEWLGFKKECEVEKFDDEGNTYTQYALIR